MIFQMRTNNDEAPILRKIGQLSVEDRARVAAEIWQMLKPPFQLSS
jgi:hypothetical protein